MIPLLITSVLISAPTVLFVGNSYTMFGGGQWTIVKDIYDSVSSDTLITGNHTVGGSSFQNHWENDALHQLIQSGAWDICVFQEQSCMPVIAPELTYTFGDSLAFLCQDNGTQPTYFMTWARRNDPLMLAGLYLGYSRMGFTHNSLVSPCGVAFDLMRLNHHEINPYSGDGAHPSIEGSYLTGCVIASTILHVDLTQAGIWQPEEITNETGEILREVAVEACSLYAQPREM